VQQKQLRQNQQAQFLKGYSQRLSKIRVSLLSVLCVVIFFVIGCGTVGQSASAQMTDAQIEAKVLEVIRKNPQVILESVQNYQQEQQRKQSEARENVRRQVAQEPRLLLRGAAVTGATSQKIILAEFSDFQCPYCKRGAEVLKEFMTKNQNKVTLVFKHFPLDQIHSQARPAAQAAWAAQQQNKFWEYHDGLFQDQDKLNDGFYEELAKKLQLDVTKFNQDRASDAAKEAVQKDLELGISLGINGTPTLLLNGKVLSGVPDLQELQKAVDELAGKV
jgi:protein-disulfide isomerase